MRGFRNRPAPNKKRRVSFSPRRVAFLTGDVLAADNPGEDAANWGEEHRSGYMCHALISKSEVQKAETNELINKIYDGSANHLWAALLGKKGFSTEQIEKLKQMVADWEGIPPFEVSLPTSTNAGVFLFVFFPVLLST